MFKKVLLGLLALVVVVTGVVVIAASMQPTDYRISRSATMAAPPSAVFAQVNDFHNWEGWSPWIKLDPAAKETFEGPTSGVGAIFKWSGNDEVGEGGMTILESRPDELIKIKLDFVRPFEDTATVDFTFKPASDQTEVTWTMSGHHTFVSKIFCLFMNMDQMIGKDFDKGLASMKGIVEAKK